MNFLSYVIFAFAVYGVFCFIKNIVRIVKELKFKNLKVVKEEKENEFKR